MLITTLPRTAFFEHAFTASKMINYGERKNSLANESGKVSVSAIATWLSPLNHFLCVHNIPSVMLKDTSQRGKGYC